LYGKSYFWSIIAWAIVFLSKCLSDQMLSGQLSLWANVFLGNCLSGQMSFWANVFWANVFIVKCLSGQMSFWANAVWLNVSGQMSFGQMSWDRMSRSFGAVRNIVAALPGSDGKILPGLVG
jgi:hypothetical protein